MPNDSLIFHPPLLHPVPADSLAADTAVHRTVTGIVLVDPHPRHDATPRRTDHTDLSWVLLGIFAVFALICLRMSRNSEFFKSLLRDLTSVRERHNIFDDTVRETSFLLLLTVMCAITEAVLLYTVMLSFGLLPAALTPTRGMLLCLAATGAYCILMPGVYWLMGRIFSDGLRTRIWLRGFTASQGLLGLSLLPLALIALFYPAATGVVLPLAGALFAIVKIIFISKGFRIFFTDFSSWLLFLYYLCSLELVPLILTYTAALRLCLLLA